MEELITGAKELMDAGGPIMWPLLALSVVALTLSIERGFYWLRTHRPGRSRWLDALIDALRSGDAASARKLSAGDNSLYARVTDNLLRRGATAAPHLAADARRETERFAATLSTIITAAPLLGILGTVLGIIQSFDLLGGARNIGDLSTVAAGIAEALITTAAGLTVALITLFPYAASRAHARRAAFNLEAVLTAHTDANK